VDWLCQCLALSKSIKIVYNVLFGKFEEAKTSRTTVATHFYVAYIFFGCHTRHGHVIFNDARSAARFLHKKPEVLRF